MSAAFPDNVRTQGANRSPRHGGFTLVEAVIAVALVALVATLAVRRMSSVVPRAETLAAESDMRAIADALDGESGLVRDMAGIPGFSPAQLRLANLFMPTNLYGSVPAGPAGRIGARVDDTSVRREGVAPASAFTAWDEERSRGWRGPYLKEASGRFPERGSRRRAGDATADERGFFPALSGLLLPSDIVSGLDGCSVYGFPGEPAALDPWGNPYVLQVPPPQAFGGDATNVADAVRFSYARIVSAGPDGVLSAPCFSVNATNAYSTSWTERTRRMSRQAGLVDGNDFSARGDDLVLFLRRADIDEGEEP